MANMFQKNDIPGDDTRSSSALVRSAVQAKRQQPEKKQADASSAADNSVAPTFTLAPDGMRLDYPKGFSAVTTKVSPDGKHLIAYGVDKKAPDCTNYQIDLPANLQTPYEGLKIAPIKASAPTDSAQTESGQARPYCRTYGRTTEGVETGTYRNYFDDTQLFRRAADGKLALLNPGENVPVSVLAPIDNGSVPFTAFNPNYELEVYFPGAKLWNRDGSITDFKPIGVFQRQTDASDMVGVSPNGKLTLTSALNFQQSGEDFNFLPEAVLFVKQGDGSYKEQRPQLPPPPIDSMSGYVPWASQGTSVQNDKANIIVYFVPKEDAQKSSFDITEVKWALYEMNDKGEMKLSGIVKQDNNKTILISDAYPIDGSPDLRLVELSTLNKKPLQSADLYLETTSAGKTSYASFSKLMKSLDIPGDKGQFPLSVMKTADVVVMTFEGDVKITKDRKTFDKAVEKATVEL